MGYDFHLGQEVILVLPFELDVAAVAKQIKMRSVETDLTEVASGLIEMVKKVARPRAVYRPLKIEHIDGSSFHVGGKVFKSRVLTKVLDENEPVFVYIVTIGPELDALTLPQNDMLSRYRLDAVKTMILGAAGKAFETHLKSRYPQRRLTHINPGEIEDWPLTEQKPLFTILNSAADELGVILTEGCMIKPVKSRSGIYFANDDGFETCRLCTQFRCPGRRAAFDAGMLARLTA